MHLSFIWSHWSGRIGAVVFTVVVGVGVVVGFSTTARTVAPRESAVASRADVVVPTKVRAQLAASVVFSPARNATGVKLDAPVVVATKSNGFLTSVRLVDTSGHSIPGGFEASRSSWWSHSSLLAGHAYEVEATLGDASGVTTTVTSRFTTLIPAVTVHAAIFPHDGLTVGVGQPVTVRFDQPVTNDAARASVLQHIKVTATKPLDGLWHWFSPTELHFRPRTFWPAGDQVTISADLGAWNVGNGVWGDGAQTEHFTIGDAHVATANLATHVMTVTSNGKVVATYPFSGGRDKFPTMNGTHIVMDRESVVHMVSSTNGIPVNSPDGYDELVYNDVHISDSGEYVHAAPWSVGSQGRANVSHGCINLSNPDALAFFNFSRVGDVVVVAGGPRPPSLGDHGVMDWDTPVEQWTPAPAATATPPASTTPPSSNPATVSSR